MAPIIQVQDELIKKMQELIDALNRQLASSQSLIEVQDALIKNLESQIGLLKLRAFDFKERTVN